MEETNRELRQDLEEVSEIIRDATDDANELIRAPLKVKRVEPEPPQSASFRRFWACRPCLASARLRPPHPKSLENLALWGASQFSPSGFRRAEAKPAGNPVGLPRDLTTDRRKQAGENRLGLGSPHLNLNQIYKGTKVKVVKDTVTSVDFENREVVAEKKSYPYDTLVLATGSKPTWFGTPGAEEFCKPMWSYEDAVALREHIKMQFCKAKLEQDAAVRKRMLTFFVVGAGFTGVELTGELAEWIPSLCTAYSIPYEDVTLVECDMMDRVVLDFPKRLSAKIAARLENMGVKLLLKTKVKEVAADSITIDQDGRERKLMTDTVIWAAGVEGSELMETVGENLVMGGRYRVKVNQYMQAEGQRGVYIGGDNIYYMIDGKPAPQVVENAKQTAAVIAHNITAAICKIGEKKAYKPSFHGFMVSLGGRYGVANVGVNDTRVPLSPFLSIGAKHFSNMVYLTTVAGLFRVADYIEDEFLEVPDRRSFVSIRARQPWHRK